METKLPDLQMLVVKLDCPAFGAVPATVVSHVATVAEYDNMNTDRDGARDPKLRLWLGNFPIGARVTLNEVL